MNGQAVWITGEGTRVVYAGGIPTAGWRRDDVGLNFLVLNRSRVGAEVTDDRFAAVGAGRD